MDPESDGKGRADVTERFRFPLSKSWQRRIVSWVIGPERTLHLGGIDLLRGEVLVGGERWQKGLSSSTSLS